MRQWLMNVSLLQGWLPATLFAITAALMVILLIGAIASLSGTYARVYLFWGIISAFSFVLLAVSNFKYRPAPQN